MNTTCFYVEDIKIFLVNFCKKIIKDKRKSLLVFQDLDTVNFFDNELWKFDFLAHCRTQDGDLIQNTPLLLIEEKELDSFKNNYDNILFGYAPSIEILKEINKKTAILLNDKNFQYKNIDVSYMIKNGNSWIQI